MLGNCTYLNLTGCNKIVDVSTLGNVKKLNLSHCYEITDVSMLGNVNIFSYSNLDKMKEFISVYNNINQYTYDIKKV